MYISTYICNQKIVTKILMDLKIWCQVGGRGTQFSKLQYVREFSNIWFQKLTDIRRKRSLGLGNVNWTFIVPAEIRHFGTLKMFYPEGTLQSRYQRRSNCFYLPMSYFVLGNLYWTFQFCVVIRLLRPWKCFILRRDGCLQTQCWALSFWMQSRIVQVSKIINKNK